MKPIRNARPAMAALGLFVLVASACSPGTPEPVIGGPGTAPVDDAALAPWETGNTEAPGAELGEVTPVPQPALPAEASADPGATPGSPSATQTESIDVDEVDPLLEEIEALLGDLDELLSDTEDALGADEGDL